MKLYHSIYVPFVIVFSLSFGSGIALAEETDTVDGAATQVDTDAPQEEKKSDDDKAVGGILGYTPVGIIVNAVDSAADEDDPQKETQNEDQEKTDE